MPSAAPTNADLAARYQCAVRTIVRLRKSGVDVSDAAAVAEAMATQKNISIQMAQAVIDQLEATKSDD